MTEYDIRLGDPANPERVTAEGNDAAIEPMDPEGTRRLTVWDTDGGEPTEVFVATVGPDHILTYTAMQ